MFTPADRRGFSRAPCPSKMNQLDVCRAGPLVARPFRGERKDNRLLLGGLLGQGPPEDMTSTTPPAATTLPAGDWREGVIWRGAVRMGLQQAAGCPTLQAAWVVCSGSGRLCAALAKQVQHRDGAPCAEVARPSGEMAEPMR